jgi:hypothetical protein
MRRTMRNHSEESGGNVKTITILTMDQMMCASHFHAVPNALNCSVQSAALPKWYAIYLRLVSAAQALLQKLRDKK